MGFEFTPKSYALSFTDSDLAGLEVSAGPLSIEDLLALELALYSPPGDDVPTQVAKYREVVALFAASLQSWNLERDGQPVGTDVAAVSKLDSGLILRIVRGWYRALVVPPDPLPNGSSDTPDTALEPSIPMTAVSSQSLPN